MGEGRKKGPGGGGAALNFKVVAYATEELLMAATGKDNEIGIITSTSMTGWHFAAEQPEMQAGEVWISTGTASQVAFNALKKGGTVMVYPLSAKQMQGGTLVDVTAKSWQDGEWVDWWTGVLYDSGDQFEGITGGWISQAYTCGIGYTGGNAVAPSLTVNDFNIKASVSGSGIVRTSNLIDVSNFSILRFKGVASWSGGQARLCLWPDTGGNWDTNAAASLTFTNNAANEYELDIEELSGQYYIGLGLYHDATVTMDSMRLVR